MKSITQIIDERKNNDSKRDIENIFLRLMGDGQANGRLVVSIGSSLTAQGLVATSTRWGRDLVGPMEWATILCGQRFIHVNKAWSGKTSSEMTGWLQNEVLALNPAVVVVQNGTNEMGTGYDSIVAVSKNFYDSILASGAHLIVCGEQTREKAGSGWTDNELRSKAAINIWKRRYCESHPRCHYAGIDKYLIDPTTASGEPLSGMLRDGTHYTPRGAFRAGKSLSEILSVLIPPQDVLMPDVLTVGTGLTYGCITGNPAFSGTGGGKGTGVTGNVPNLWQVERVSGTTTGTVAADVAARSTLDPRREMSLTFTPGGSATEEFFIRTNPATTTITDIVNLYEALVGVDCAAWEGWKNIQLEVDDQGPSTLFYYASSNVYNLPLPELAWDGILRTPPFVPSGDLRFRLRVGIGGLAAGTGVLKVFAPQINILSPDSAVSGPYDTYLWRNGQSA